MSILEMTFYSLKFPIYVLIAVFALGTIAAIIFLWIEYRRGKPISHCFIFVVLFIVEVIAASGMIRNDLSPASAADRVAVASRASRDYAHARGVLHALSQTAEKNGTLRHWQAERAIASRPAVGLTERDIPAALASSTPPEKDITSAQQCEIARYIAPKNIAESVCNGNHALAEAGISKPDKRLAAPMPTSLN